MNEYSSHDVALYVNAINKTMAKNGVTKTISDAFWTSDIVPILYPLWDSDRDKLEREYQLDKPKGVRGRSSNNDLVKKILNWSYKIKLKDGLKSTYDWINSETKKTGNKPRMY